MEKLSWNLLEEDPCPIYGHTAASFAHYMLVFGSSEFGILNDGDHYGKPEIFLYDSNSENWYILGPKTNFPLNLRFENPSSNVSSDGSVPRILTGTTSEVTCRDGHLVFYLFGGFEPDAWLLRDTSPTAQRRHDRVNHVYALDLTRLRWLPEVTAVSAIDDSDSSPTGKARVSQQRRRLPSPRDKHNMCVYGERLYVFGGYGPSIMQYLHEQGNWDASGDPNGGLDETLGWNNQLLELDLRALVWRNPRTSGSIPASRAASASCLVRNLWFIFGGRHLHSRLNDLYFLNLDTLVWTRLEFESASGPSPRSWATLTLLSHHAPASVGVAPGDEQQAQWSRARPLGCSLLLYGGFAAREDALGDCWLLETRCTSATSSSCHWRALFEREAERAAESASASASEEALKSAPRRPARVVATTTRVAPARCGFPRIWHTSCSLRTGPTLASAQPELAIFGGCVNSIFGTNPLPTDTTLFYRFAPPSLSRECIEQLATEFVELASESTECDSGLALLAAACETAASGSSEKSVAAGASAGELQHQHQHQHPQASVAPPSPSASASPAGRFEVFAFDGELPEPLADALLERLARWLAGARRRLAPALGDQFVALCLSRLRRERLRRMRRLRKALRLRTRWRITTRIRLLQQQSFQLNLQQRTYIFEIFTRELECLEELIHELEAIVFNMLDSEQSALLKRLSKPSEQPNASTSYYERANEQRLVLKQKLSTLDSYEPQASPSDLQLRSQLRHTQTQTDGRRRRWATNALEVYRELDYEGSAGPVTPAKDPSSGAPRDPFDILMRHSVRDWLFILDRVQLAQKTVLDARRRLAEPACTDPTRVPLELQLAATKRVRRHEDRLARLAHLRDSDNASAVMGQFLPNMHNNLFAIMMDQFDISDDDEDEDNDDDDDDENAIIDNDDDDDDADATDEDENDEPEPAMFLPLPGPIHPPGAVLVGPAPDQFAGDIELEAPPLNAIEWLPPIVEQPDALDQQPPPVLFPFQVPEELEFQVAHPLAAQPDMLVNVQIADFPLILVEDEPIDEQPNDAPMMPLFVSPQLSLPPPSFPQPSSSSPALSFSLPQHTVPAAAAAAAASLTNQTTSCSDPLVHQCFASSSPAFPASDASTSSLSLHTLQMDVSPQLELPPIGIKHEHSAADVDQLLEASDSDSSEMALEPPALDAQLQFGRKSVAASSSLGIEAVGAEGDKQHMLISALLSDDESDSELDDESVARCVRDSVLNSGRTGCSNSASASAAPISAPDSAALRADAADMQPAHAVDSTLSISHSAATVRAAAAAQLNNVVEQAKCERVEDALRLQPRDSIIDSHNK